MSYPVIILGAGASFDYIHESSTTKGGRFKPPLTSELFDSRFEDIIKQFPEAEPLSGKIAAGLRNGQSLETTLKEIKSKATQNNLAQCQLIALEFYLQTLFQKISENYSGQSQNNYLTLINEIRMNGDQAALITFNYDTLLDKCLNLGGEFNDYIKNKIKLIKIHGSCDWNYILNRENIFTHDINNAYQLLMTSPQMVSNINHRGQFISPSLYSKNSINDYKPWLIPALAVPLPDKTDVTCPEDHYLSLINALRQTKQILIIGWSASDDYFIKLIEDNITPTASITIVSGSKDSIEDIKQKITHLKKSKKIVFASEHVGFSSFMGSTTCKNFFNQMEANINS